MKSKRFPWILGTVFIAAWLALWWWQNPGTRIGAADGARYLAAIEKLPFPAEERAEVLRRARAWIDSDDGRPVYMLNLMRYYPELKRFPGSIDFKGTPRESNARYEDEVMPMLFKVGGYPVYAGDMPGRNLLAFEPGLDDWNRLLVVRYPSRRAFLDLITRPEYATIEPYKLMALSVVLSPTAVQMAIPELHWAALAVLVSIFLGLGWWRSARQLRGAAPSRAQGGAR